MAKMLKIIGITAAALIILLYTAFLAIKFFVNPNRYTPELIQTVKERTGHDLHINGDIKWSLFPWLSIEVYQVQLDSTPAFPNTPLVSIGEANVSLRLRSLFSKKLEFGNLTIKKVHLNLLTDSKGEQNWAMQPTTAKVPAAPAAQPTSQPPAPKEDTAAWQHWHVSGIEVRDANITLSNARLGHDAQIANFVLQSKDIRAGAPFHIKMRFKFLSRSSAVGGEVAVKLRTTLHPERGITLLQADTAGTLQKGSSANPVIPFTLKSAITHNAPEQRLTFESMTASLDSLALKGEGQFSTAGKGYSATLNTNQFDLKQLLTNLGHPLYTQNPNALSRFGGAFVIKGAGDKMVLSPINVRVDNSSLQGDVRLAPQALSYRLNLDKLNLEDYRMTASPMPARAQAQSIVPATNGTPQVAPGSAALEDKTVPQIKLDGQSKVGYLQWANYQFTQIEANTTGEAGNYQTQYRSRFMDGTLTGRLKMSYPQNIPTYRASFNGQNIDLKHLFKRFQNVSKLSLQGSATVKGNLNTSGQDAETRLKKLNGRVTFAAQNGELKNLDIPDLVDHHLSKLTQKTGLPGSRTLFSSLTATFVVNNGIAQSNNISLVGPHLQVTGVGAIDLVRQTVNIALVAIQNGGKQLRIPITIKGPLANPKIKVDQSKLLQETLKHPPEQIMNQLEKKLKKKDKNNLFKIFGR